MFLFAAASLILATGCEEPEPEKTAEPQIFDFQVPEEEIEAFSARIIITCSDESLLWYYGLALSSDIAEDPYFAENARQSLLEYVKIMGGSYSLTDLLYPGDFIDDRTWTRLDMNSAYTPFAFGLDENGDTVPASDPFSPVSCGIDFIYNVSKLHDTTAPGKFLPGTETVRVITYTAVYLLEEHIV